MCLIMYLLFISSIWAQTFELTRLNALFMYQLSITE